MGEITNLEPQAVFQYFEELNQVPRGTFDTRRVSDWLVSVAKRNHLDYIQDEIGNVIIRKEGSAGYTNAEPVIIQGHMDMVCEKTEDSTHDFSKDPIEMHVENGFVKAKDTTLGADDGVAIAFALAALTDESVVHPPLEVVITVDEETGMGGANGIDLSVLKGKKLINLDTDIEGNIVAGCAGGFRGIVKLPLEREKITGEQLQINVKGLYGGHSGLDIGEQRGNANKMMGRLLVALALEAPYALVDFNGGALDNVICLSATANIIVEENKVDAVKSVIGQMKETWDVEFGGQEPGLLVQVTEKGTVTEQAMTEGTRSRVLTYVTCAPYGVLCYNRQLAGSVETSNNLGMAKTTEDTFETWGQGRSSMESKKVEIQNQLRALALSLGGTFEVANDYPGWSYKADSNLRPIVTDNFQKLYGKEPNVATVHAGLECGIFLGKKPDLDCVSFGPNMFDCHSVKERLEIASAQRTWKLFLAVLEDCR